MPLSGLRILLAEDSATNRLVTEQMLTGLGAAVVLARDGAEALNLLEREQFDVLLVDIEMPNVSGLEVVRRVRARGRRGGPATAIALTGHASREHREKLTEAGIDGVITKPIVSIERFGEEILSYVHRHGAEAAPTAAEEPDELDDPNEPDDPDEPEMDMEAYRALASAIGPDQLGDLLGKVDADISSAYDRMRRGIAESDTDEVRAATHIMMAVAGAIGASGLQMLSQRLNRAAHEAPETMDAIGSEAGAEAERVLRFVRQEMSG